MSDKTDPVHYTIPDGPPPESAVVVKGLPDNPDGGEVWTFGLAPAVLHIVPPIKPSEADPPPTP